MALKRIIGNFIDFIDDHEGLAKFLGIILIIFALLFSFSECVYSCSNYNSDDKNLILYPENAAENADYSLTLDNTGLKFEISQEYLVTGHIQYKITSSPYSDNYTKFRDATVTFEFYIENTTEKHTFSIDTYGKINSPYYTSVMHTYNYKKKEPKLVSVSGTYYFNNGNLFDTCNSLRGESKGKKKYYVIRHNTVFILDDFYYPDSGEKYVEAYPSRYGPKRFDRLIKDTMYVPDYITVAGEQVKVDILDTFYSYQKKADTLILDGTFSEYFYDEKCTKYLKNIYIRNYISGYKNPKFHPGTNIYLGSETDAYVGEYLKENYPACNIYSDYDFSNIKPMDNKFVYSMFGYWFQ